MGGTFLSTNAPPAMLHPVGERWLVDISFAAAPGPGPVWLHEEFETAKEAVKAIEECFFAGRASGSNDSLTRWYGAFESQKLDSTP